INLPQFWLRRIRRLFPAIVTVIVVMSAVFALFSPLLLTKMRPDIIPGLFWFENWWYILRDLSYFEAVGAPSPLTHFWSLAIEEQFYLVWPIILLTIYKVGVGKKSISRMCLVLALVSAVAMAVLYDPAGDPSRVYYGTDTRAFSLLIGAWLSFAWPSSQLSGSGSRNAANSSVGMLDIAGLVAFIGILLMCIFISGFSDFMYYGGLVLCSVLSAVVIASLVHPRTIMSKVFAWDGFVWLGKRSYGMYLWHFPIICLLQPRNATMIPWWIYLIEMALIIGISALSYRFIEKPIRTQGLSAFRALPAAVGAYAKAGGRKAGKAGKALAGAKPSFAGWVKSHVPATAFAAAVLALSLGGIVFVPPVAEGGVAADEQKVMSATLIKPLVDGVYDVVFIGDSVSLGANQELNDRFPHGMIDTEGCRQYFQGIEVLQGYLDKGVVGDTVVMSMSTNGYAEEEELEEVMELCGPDRSVWFVNIRVPDERCEPNNAAIQACVDAHENAHLIDWYAASAGHDEWLIEDGIHLTWDGREAFANLVVDTMHYVVPTDANSKYDITFIGDVVTLNAVEQLAELFPRGVVDCADARTTASVQAAYDNYVNSKVVGNVVVLALGAEEKLNSNEVSTLLESIGPDKEVWLITSRTPSPFCDSNNALLQELAANNAKVNIIDWYALTVGHDNYLQDNGVNLTEEGVAAYVAEINRLVGPSVAQARAESESEEGDEAQEADEAQAGDETYADLGSDGETDNGDTESDSALAA
ncbi:MAG: acyltransferase, partial [Eggerthellaceae bacterium]|nr:acyltransferase [Eggerthellaceae bacterium]